MSTKGWLRRWTGSWPTLPAPSPPTAVLSNSIILIRHHQRRFWQISRRKNHQTNAIWGLFKVYILFYIICLIIPRISCACCSQSACGGLFLGKLGPLEQLQQNMWWRGEKLFWLCSDMIVFHPMSMIYPFPHHYQGRICFNPVYTSCFIDRDVFPYISWIPESQNCHTPGWQVFWQHTVGGGLYFFIDGFCKYFRHHPLI